MPAPRPAAASSRSAPTQSVNVFDAVVKHVADIRADGRKVVIAGWTEGSLDRLAQILAEHHLEQLKPVAHAGRRGEAEAGAGGPRRAADRGGLRCRALRRRRRAGHSGRPAGAPLEEAQARRPISSPRLASLAAGDLVVHSDHGIGRFIGLKTIEAAGAPHDCLEIHYAGDGRLFLPVENIELLSRYGSEATEAVLDKLGGGAWQSRKAS